jgi:hypothetical protein
MANQCIATEWKAKSRTHPDSFLDLKGKPAIIITGNSSLGLHYGVQGSLGRLKRLSAKKQTDATIYMLLARSKKGD